MIVITECPSCQGEGRKIVYGLVYEPGCGHPHMGDRDIGLCDECQGACVIDVETAARTLADLEQEDYDMMEAGCARVR